MQMYDSRLKMIVATGSPEMTARVKVRWDQFRLHARYTRSVWQDGFKSSRRELIPRCIWRPTGSSKGQGLFLEWPL